jgi:hypothetical protein
VAARPLEAAGWTTARCRGGRDAPWHLAARSPGAGFGRERVFVATRPEGVLVHLLGEPEAGYLPPTAITDRPRPVRCRRVAHRNGRPPSAIRGPTREITWSSP